MATVSRSNFPFDSNFYVATSGTASGTFNQTLVTVPTGKALVINQVTAGANVVINYVNGTSYQYPLNLTASTATSPPNLVIGPGVYTLNTTLSGAYSWSVTGYYVLLNG